MPNTAGNCGLCGNQWFVAEHPPGPDDALAQPKLDAALEIFAQGEQGAALGKRVDDEPDR